MFLARSQPGLGDAFEIADLWAAKVGQDPGWFVEHDLGEMFSNLSRIHRLKLPVEGDGGDPGEARESTGEDFHETVELGRAKNRPGHDFLPHDSFGRELDPMVRICAAINADDRYINHVRDVRLPGQREQAPGAAHVDGPAGEGLATGRGCVD